MKLLVLGGTGLAGRPWQQKRRYAVIDCLDIETLRGSTATRFFSAATRSAAPAAGQAAVDHAVDPATPAGDSRAGGRLTLITG